MIVIAGLLLFCINIVVSKTCVLDDGSRYRNNEIRLKKDLLSSYNSFESPQNTTTVEARFILKYFYFENNEEVFNTYSWVLLSWSDERLKWDPSKYGGIAETEINYFVIWSPKLNPESKLAYMDYDYYSIIFNGVCHVSNTGDVTCLTHARSKSECISDVSNWPHDIQTCSFKFGLHSMYAKNTVIALHSQQGISTFAAEYGPGWNIIDYKTEDNLTCGSQIRFTFVVERQGKSIAAIVVFPMFALSILTVTTLFLDDHNTRVGMQILSILIHIYIMTFVNAFIPFYGAKIPSVVRFVTASFILTVTAAILSFVLNYVRRRKVAPQNWIVAVNDYVLNSHVKFLIWPRRELRNQGTSSSETVKCVSIWTDFTHVVNAVCIVMCITVYFITILCFMPKQLPIDYTTL